MCTREVTRARAGHEVGALRSRHVRPGCYTAGMRTVTLIALVFLAAPFVRVAMQGTELRASYWPNGRPRSQIEAHRNLQGELIRDGRVQLFHEDGSLSAQGLFRDDLEQGRWVWYTYDGVVKGICEYSAGIGHYRELTPDGRVLREGSLHGDDREGHWREYYPDGRVKLEGDYLENQQHGDWTAWTDEDPPRFRSVRFEHGEIVGPN